jgi:hypothetical protein
MNKEIFEIGGLIISIIVALVVIVILLSLIFSKSESIIKQDIFELTAKLTKENFSIEPFTFDSAILPDKLKNTNLPKDFFIRKSNPDVKMIEFSVLLYDWMKLFLAEVCDKPPTTDSFLAKIYMFNKDNNLNSGVEMMQFSDSLICIILLSLPDKSKQKILFGSLLLLFLKGFTDYDEINKVLIFKNFDDKFSYDLKLNTKDYPDYKIPKDKLCELALNKYNDMLSSGNMPVIITNAYSKFSIC